MVNAIEISPELVRLAQIKSSKTGQPLSNELARSLFEEAVMALDPELNLVVGSDNLSEIDTLVETIGINDVTINDHHIDVRALDADGRISVCRALVGTPYLAAGSFVVAMNGTDSGNVVAYIGPGGWLSAEQQNKEDRVYMSVKTDENFDFGRALVDVCNRVQIQVPVPAKSLPDASELGKFVNQREQIIVARQKQIVTALVTNSMVRELVVNLPQQSNSLSHEKVTRIISDSAIWNARVEYMAAKLASKFNALTIDEVRALVRKTGENLGGHPDAPQFRKELVSQLTREQIARRFQSVPVAKVSAMVEQVLSGRSAAEAVKDFIKSKVAIDLASTIKRQRQRAEGFAAASAEEIGLAFKQLALQPAYATHSSQSADSGVEAINEALQLLEAGDLAEQAQALDMELAGN